MLKQLFLLFAVLSLTFSITGAQCPQVKQDCTFNACTKAGGEINQLGNCEKPSGFNEQIYSEELSKCETIYGYCTQNDGFVHNMSCCGPVATFVLMLLALCADGKP